MRRHRIGAERARTDTADRPRGAGGRSRGPVRRRRRGAPYDAGVLSPALVGLVLALGLLVLLPARRLHLGGWPSSWIAAYYITVLVLALLVAELRGPARFLVPILVVAYLAPFVTLREGLARLIGRPQAPPPARRDPPRNVTPPDADAGGAGRR